MNLQCEVERASGYRSASQIARVVSEHWCARELYCPACDEDRLTGSAPNRPAIDFECPRCNQLYQLKSVRSWNQRKIVDAGYVAMIRAIRNDATPNLFLLHYSTDWCVRNLLLVPKMFFTESVIERRPPLGDNARKAGWVGCNILLHRIPEDGKITIVSEGVTTPGKDIRQEFARIRKLSEVPPISARMDSRCAKCGSQIAKVGILVARGLLIRVRTQLTAPAEQEYPSEGETTAAGLEGLGHD